MALNMDVLRKRLREAFGGDSQETVGKKLNMTQGNVSKLLSGSQQPTIETIYHISKAYDVSADWLMGLSEKKRVTKHIGEATYSSVIEALMALKTYGATIMFNDQIQTVSISSGDPLLRALLKKSHTLSNTDRELYQSWMENRLSLFEDKSLIWNGTWRDETVSFLASEATTESNWIEVHDVAMKVEKEDAEMMGDDVSPFKG